MAQFNPFNNTSLPDAQFQILLGKGKILIFSSSIENQEQKEVSPVIFVSVQSGLDMHYIVIITRMTGHRY